jgi:hypothetical protein
MFIGPGQGDVFVEGTAARMKIRFCDSKIVVSFQAKNAPYFDRIKQSDHIVP